MRGCSSDAAWSSLLGWDQTPCSWQKDEDATRKELQQVETNDEGRRQSWPRDLDDEKVVDTDDGETRSTWREYHGSICSNRGQLIKSLKVRDRSHSQSEAKRTHPLCICGNQQVSLKVKLSLKVKRVFKSLGAGAHLHVRV